MVLPALPYADATSLADHWWWRPGWQVGTRYYAWHVTLTDQPALRHLVATYQAALSGFPTLDPIPGQWLHITVQGVGHTRDVPDTERDAVVEAVRDELAAVPTPQLTFGRPVLHREAVVIPPTDPEPLRAIRAAIQRRIAAVRGWELVPDVNAGYRPHVSVAYANETADPAPIRAALDAVGNPAAKTIISHVAFIVMHRDRRMYEWHEAASCYVGTANIA